MKDDLKNFAIGTVIYLGLLIISTTLFAISGAIADKYPAIRSFGNIFSALLLSYWFVRWLINKRQKSK